MQIDVDEVLKDADKSELKSHYHTFAVDDELDEILSETRRIHGTRKTAKIVRKLLRIGLTQVIARARTGLVEDERAG